MRTSIQDLFGMKEAGQLIPMVTAYDFASGALAERAGLRLLLVGDSLGMVMQGHKSTLPVTLDDMVRHTAAVVRGTKQALIVADMPFLSYATVEDGVRAAGRLMAEGGAQAVKLEGGRPVLPLVRRLVELGIPVMGHLGYTPQSTNQIGVRVQAKDAQAAHTLIEDAHALEAAGAFAVVLELVPASLAEAISGRLRIPTIGIGAGAGCDGQVQVWHDILGLMEEKPPRHAKVFSDIGAQIVAALASYAGEVEARSFPTKAQSSNMSEDVLAQALAQADHGKATVLKARRGS